MRSDEKKYFPLSSSTNCEINPVNRQEFSNNSGWQPTGQNLESTNSRNDSQKWDYTPKPGYFRDSVDVLQRIHRLSFDGSLHRLSWNQKRMRHQREHHGYNTHVEWRKWPASGSVCRWRKFHPVSRVRLEVRSGLPPFGDLRVLQLLRPTLNHPPVPCLSQNSGS